VKKNEILAEHAAHIVRLREAYLNHFIERWKAQHLQQIVRAAAPPERKEKAA